MASVMKKFKNNIKAASEEPRHSKVGYAFTWLKSSPDAKKAIAKRKKFSNTKMFESGHGTPGDPYLKRKVLSKKLMPAPEGMMAKAAE